MRLRFLLTHSLENPGGIGRYGPIARYLVRQGHAVEIVALHPAWQDLKQRRFERDGVQVRYVAQMHVQRQGNYKRYFSPSRLLWVALRATWALMLAGLEPTVDALHICKAQPMNGLAGWLAARWRRRPLFVDCDDLEVASNRFSGQWQRSVVGWWENHLPLAARGVTVNTRFQQAR